MKRAMVVNIGSGHCPTRIGGWTGVRRYWTLGEFARRNAVIGDDRVIDIINLFAGRSMIEKAKQT